MDRFDFLMFQTREHDAWLNVVAELKELGIEIEEGEPGHKLHDLITVWGEELAQLRLADPDKMHANNALVDRRKKAARWDQ